jgi:hypothetical protein
MSAFGGKAATQQLRLPRIEEKQSGSSPSRSASGQVSELNFCVNIAKEIDKKSQWAVFTLWAHFVRPKR